MRDSAQYSLANASLTSAFIYLAVMAAKKKNRHAVALSKLRMLKTTPEQRSAAASIAGKASGASKSSEELSRMAQLGGAARAAKLTPEERSDVARRAAAARWAKKKAKAEELS